MCGILAVICSTIPNQLKQILLSRKCLATRGPDRCTSIIKSNGIYIFHRLCINDVSSKGDQPMFSNNIVMMCNGEIYNHKKLRQEYKLKCTSESDCEVILRLYEKLGFEHTVKLLDGVFAIVLVDGNTAYLARDRIGVRPLYLGWTEEEFLAVSSIPNPLVTFCNRIVPCCPGVSLMYDKNKKELTPLYKDYLWVIEPSDTPYAALHNALTNAVKKRLMSDRPMACLLSGGLDSSIITAILVKLLGPENTRTYSIGMTDSPDLYYAKKVSEYLGTQHTEVIFTPEEGFAVIPDVIETLASYDITTIRASVGMYLLCKYISENTKDKVIFSGEGSDELFCGYLYFHNAPTPEDAAKESIRLINDLHLYDVLRADRCVSVHGLELRVPFLDRSVVDLALSLGGDKMPQHGIEKSFLRNAFTEYLPTEILQRQKCAFSDGVSSIKKSWYQYIQDMILNKLGNEVFCPKKYHSHEAMYYKLIFDKHFPSYNLQIPYWMPKWSDSNDPSARFLPVCKN
jgi:asparagine synthase (glutamine-hydrolysing)